jgi:hypothetical protein
MKIMLLRGLKRTEQQLLIDSYNMTVGNDDQIKLKPERGTNFTNMFSQLGAKVVNAGAP